MLVVSRQRDERVIIDLSEITPEQFAELQKSPIEITVVDVRGDKARIGLTAPKYVKVWREELWTEIQKTNRRQQEYLKSGK